MSILLPLHRSVPCYRRPGPGGRGGDFFWSGDATAQGESTQSRRVSHAGTRTPGLMIQSRLKGGLGLWRLRGGGTEPSSLFVCPQRRLLRGNSSAVKLGKAQLPFFHQLCSLSRAALGTGKHPFCMDALLRRFVQRLAGGMIGHTTPDAHGKSVQNGFYTSWLSTGRGACPCGQALDRIRVRLSFSGRLAMPSPPCRHAASSVVCAPPVPFPRRVLLRGFRVRRG